ncbi:Retrovirus-related Pol polyprotein LINE-1 [Aphis craccivora]|uniref:Retrovirus-related Pol polyprotein LINE-1 n=1 Tax=Aphis craccivora TaxID=307492 RepID=A0A6G0YUM5_APHCR|nr:Retrovirus-related Pol polyprotein LINE-1 [Aphis craccivora]
MIMKNMYRVNKPMYIAFIDLEKAFDNVNWEILFDIMKTINIDIKDRRIIHKLNLNKKVVITDKRSKSWEEANIEKGVRQGCNLSPTLFNQYIENTLKQLREDEIGVIKINGMLVQMLRFADDIAFIAESEEVLGNMLTKMNDSCKEYKMKINKSKTKISICSKQELLSNITIENEKLETVQCFTYLGSKITHDERSEMDIKSKIAQAKQEFYKKKPINGKCC